MNSHFMCGILLMMTIVGGCGAKADVEDVGENVADNDTSAVSFKEVP